MTAQIMGGLLFDSPYVFLDIFQRETLFKQRDYFRFAFFLHFKERSQRQIAPSSSSGSLGNSMITTLSKSVKEEK